MFLQTSNTKQQTAKNKQMKQRNQKTIKNI